MASSEAVARVLALLHELFPTRDIGPNTLEAWVMVFADWPDDLLVECARKAARESGRTFFPTPGEITAHRRQCVVNPDAVLSRISALGHYNPHLGWIYPSVEQVRDALGDAIADAYGVAGRTPLFAAEANDGTTITRDIARRAFTTDLEHSQRLSPQTPILPPVNHPPRLTTMPTIKQLLPGEES